MILSDKLRLSFEPVEGHQLQLRRTVVNSGVVQPEIVFPVGILKDLFDLLLQIWAPLREHFSDHNIASENI